MFSLGYLRIDLSIFKNKSLGIGRNISIPHFFNFAATVWRGFMVIWKQNSLRIVERKYEHLISVQETKKKKKKTIREKKDFCPVCIRSPDGVESRKLYNFPSRNNLWLKFVLKPNWNDRFISIFPQTLTNGAAEKPVAKTWRKPSEGYRWRKIHEPGRTRENCSKIARQQSGREVERWIERK